MYIFDYIKAHVFNNLNSALKIGNISLAQKIVIKNHDNFDRSLKSLLCRKNDLEAKLLAGSIKPIQWYRTKQLEKVINHIPIAQVKQHCSMQVVQEINLAKSIHEIASKIQNNIDILHEISNQDFEQVAIPPLQSSINFSDQGILTLLQQSLTRNLPSVGQPANDVTIISSDSIQTLIKQIFNVADHKNRQVLKTIANLTNCTSNKVGKIILKQRSGQTHNYEQDIHHLRWLQTILEQLVGQYNHILDSQTNHKITAALSLIQTQLMHMERE